MKQFLFAFLLLTVSSSLPVLLALAENSPTPEVDEPLSPVDADKAVITGTTEPGASVQVTGGVYDIGVVTADEDGNFSVMVALVQETENHFSVVVTLPGSEPSEAVNVIIVEGEEEAQDYEASSGQDRTAPEAPEIEDTEVETSEFTYTIEGTGEAGASVLVNDETSGEAVDSDGNFAVEVTLSGGLQESFSISLQDKAGNVSKGVKVYVLSSSDSKIPLTDIESHWAKDYINTLYYDDIVSGYGDGRFGPDDKLTRAQIVKIALLAFDHTEENNGENPFTDLTLSDWYFNYVLAAAEQEIVTGYNDKTFRPNAEVTRAEALKIVLTAGGLTQFPSVIPNFTDVDTVADWFAKYTAYAKTSGLISGYEDGTFRGNQGITRAEVCKIVVELMDQR